MTAQSKRQNGIRSWVAIATFIVIVCGLFVGIGFWKAQASENTTSIIDHESRIRTVEETVIRTDERLSHIEEDIEDIAEEVRK